MNEEIVVSIVCTVYNHEPYLRQCLDGFVMQKTDFKFEALVHDDASTDKSAAIIREYEEKYPDIIKPIYQTENQHSKGVKISQTYLYPRAKGKYIAFCEGDDYWCDDQKLQAQVNFLEAHPECSICTHRVIGFDDGSGKELNSYPQQKWEKRFLNAPQTALPLPDFLDLHAATGYPFQTSSYVIRREILIEYAENKPYFAQDLFFGDIPMLLWCAAKGSMGYVARAASRYRRNQQGGTSWSERIYKGNPNGHLIVARSNVIMLERYDDFLGHQYQKKIKKIQVPWLRGVFIDCKLRPQRYEGADPALLEELSRMKKEIFGFSDHIGFLLRLLKYKSRRILRSLKKN